MAVDCRVGNLVDSRQLNTPSRRSLLVPTQIQAGYCMAWNIMESHVQFCAAAACIHSHTPAVDGQHPVRQMLSKHCFEINQISHLVKDFVYQQIDWYLRPLPLWHQPSLGSIVDHSW